jgi:hypothetical protein
MADKKSSKNKFKVNTSNIALIDRLITLYPQLKPDREKIIANLVYNYNSNPTNTAEEFVYEGVVYYRDSMHGVLDVTTRQVGTWEFVDNIYVYHFFKE